MEFNRRTAFVYLVLLTAMLTWVSHSWRSRMW